MKITKNSVTIKIYNRVTRFTQCWPYSFSTLDSSMDPSNLDLNVRSRLVPQREYHYNAG